ncbi:MAG: bifunctional response regulator/alkaline phosphatase family protein [Bacteroidales bacterium]|jgi:DNA-binding response OmpR family regulator|nr:bifunctional response regulator/alkaline phosphatase family protein [Bacteroidales bacterium]
MAKILWVDDEIDLLKPYIMFLEAKDYNVIPATDGQEALDILSKEQVDIMFLDENMPGINGLETLTRVKNKYPSLPVIMITKSEEEHIMEQAIGSKISDYLIKPVNPNQILLTLKKHLETQRLVSQASTMSYQQQFRDISMQLNDNLSWQEWIELYKKLIHWEIELSNSNDESIFEILKQQKEEANERFSKFYQKNYISWLNDDSDDSPTMSHQIVKNKIFPLLKANKRPVFLIVLDNFRFDQWRALKPMIEQMLVVEKEDIYYSILPTTTQYARNALFASLMPIDIKRNYPKFWIDEDKEGNKNEFEPNLLEENLKRHRLNIKTSYHKVLNATYGTRMLDILPNFLQNQLNVIVYNFIDMLSHARTESDLVRELASDENAYRGVTQTWFEHSPLIEVLKYLSTKDVDIFITTDHGSVKVNKPVRIKSNKEASVNLRYKIGRLLEFDQKDVFAVKNPMEISLPALSIMSPMVFARANDFFVYPTNYNYYVSYYMNTFQHGGISMEECLIPFIHLVKKD